MIQSAPKLKAPPNSCDCHIHIYDASYPTAKTAKVLPPAIVAAPTIWRRGNISASSAPSSCRLPAFYGKDNSLLLKSMADMGPSARGIVIVDDTVTDAELERLTKLGVRGIRFFMLAPAHALADRTAGADGGPRRAVPAGRSISRPTAAILGDFEALLKRLPTTVTIDHVGKFLEPGRAGSRRFHKALLRLLDTGKVWYKLAAPCETSKAGPPFYDDGRQA